MVASGGVVCGEVGFDVACLGFLDRKTAGGMRASVSVSVGARSTRKGERGRRTWVVDESMGCDGRKEAKC